MDYRGKESFDKRFNALVRKVEASLSEPGMMISLGSQDGVEYGIEKGTGKPLERKGDFWLYATRGD